MDLIMLGKQCIIEAMKVLEKASVEVVQFKGPTKNIQIEADLITQKAIIDTLRKSNGDFFVVEEKEEPIEIGTSLKMEVYIDPLDGSSYFLVGNKRLCCSALICLFKKEES